MRTPDEAPIIETYESFIEGMARAEAEGSPVRDLSVPLKVFVGAALLESDDERKKAAFAKAVKYATSDRDRRIIDELRESGDAMTGALGQHQSET